MPADSPEAAGQPLARAALARRRRRDAAVVLPLAGLLVFASPLLDLLAGAGRVFGIPAPALALFLAWFALIGLIARLAHPLARDGAAESEPESEAAAPNGS
jgi:hypothetical protein